MTSPPPSFSRGRALVIAVANYQDVRSLPEAVLNDARDIVAVLTSPEYCGYPEQNVTVLTDGEATLQGIRRALEVLASASNTDDTVLVFFSGHGARLDGGNAPSSALMPWDSKLTDLENTTFGEAAFSAAIDRIKARRVMVVIDACHAGGAASLKSDQGAWEGGFSEKSLQRLAVGAGRVVFASSRATETSLILSGERNSVFTSAMLSGLQGQASTSGGVIGVFDLFNYVSAAVRKAVPGRQHPIFKASELEDNFPVALVESAGKVVGSKDPALRDLEAVLVDLYPTGPTDQDIWLRAGGDISQLKLSGTGRSQWFSTLRILGLGGGGADMSRRRLVEAALTDYPNHPELKSHR